MDTTVHVSGYQVACDKGLKDDNKAVEGMNYQLAPALKANNSQLRIPQRNEISEPNRGNPRNYAIINALPFESRS